LKQYIMMKCQNCGHSVKSSVDTLRTRCSKCGKSKFIQVNAIEDFVISDVELLKNRVIALENLIQNNIQSPSVDESTRIQTLKPESKTEVMLEPKSTSPSYTISQDSTSQDSTPGIEVDPGSETVIRIKVIEKYDEEIIEDFKLLKTRIDNLDRQNKELNEMLVSNNKQYESLDTRISKAIKDHGRWLENIRNLLTTLNGQDDKINRVKKLFNKDDPLRIIWKRSLSGEIIQDI
jgi:predicted  nucleic acid-binding Zn-ribbon protein